MQRTLCHCNRLVITILSQGSPSGRLPRYARNDTVLRTQSMKFYLHHSNGLIDVHSLCYSVQRTLSLRGATRRGNLPEGLPYKTPRKIHLYLRGEKAHTSKRVSIIAPDNAISKAQCAPCSAILCHFICLVDTFYGKNKPNLCQRDTFRAFFNYSAIKFLFVAERLSYCRIVEKVVFVQVFFVKRLYVGLCGQPRLFERRFCP